MTTVEATVSAIDDAIVDSAGHLVAAALVARSCRDRAEQKNTRI